MREPTPNRLSVVVLNPIETSPLSCFAFSTVGKFPDVFEGLSWGRRRRQEEVGPGGASALPEEYLKNYTLACKLYGCEPSACVKNGLETEEGGAVNYMFIDEPGARGRPRRRECAAWQTPGHEGRILLQVHIAALCALQRASGWSGGGCRSFAGGWRLPRQRAVHGLQDPARVPAPARPRHGGNNTLKRLIVKYDETVETVGLPCLPGHSA